MYTHTHTHSVFLFWNVSIIWNVSIFIHCKYPLVKVCVLSSVPCLTITKKQDKISGSFEITP